MFLVCSSTVKAIIVLAGYFLLGPTELFKVTKSVGQLFSSIRTISTEASKNFETTMEDQLQLQEIRKAQRDLTDAFSFRRSINYEEGDEPYATKPEKEILNDDSGDSVAEGGQETKTKKKIRRRRRVVKKKEEPVAEDTSGVLEDLVMPDTATADPETEIPVETESTENLDTSPAGWFEDPQGETQPDLEQQQRQQLEASRFQQQLSSQWNDNIVENTDKLSPLSTIMERLAILEEERVATEKRLEEEFQRKTEMEEEFYARKRKLLEEAALEVQTSVFSETNSNEKKEEKAVSANAAPAPTPDLSKSSSEKK